MENAPVITLNGLSPYPDVDLEVWERHLKWTTEVNVPIMLKNSNRKGIDIYQIVKENPVYPFRLGVHHHESLSSMQDIHRTSDQKAISNDSLSWQQRNVTESIWSAVYQLVRNFRSIHMLPSDKSDTRIENAQIMHLEAYRLSPENQDKYNQWLNEYGMNIFIPLYLKQSGVKGFDYYKFTGFQLNNAREPNYPAFATVMYFESLDAFAKYEKSPELATFQKTLRGVFPRGLNYWWYVQYQLVKSWRK